MSNILTAAQAANALRVATNDARLADLLPQIDAFIESATGRDWTQDTTKEPKAITAATMLLVQWYENPGMVGDEGQMSFGLVNALTQLEAQALKYRKYQFYGASGAGSISLLEALVGDEVISLVGVYGATGDQSTKFEDAISEKNYIQQISSSDLSENLYVVILKSPKDDVIP